MTDADYNRKIRNRAFFFWLFSIFFFYLILYIIGDNTYSSDSPFYWLFGTITVGVVSFFVMIIGGLGKFSLYKDAKISHVHGKSTYLQNNPWFLISIILLIFIVFVLGRLSKPQQPPQAQPNIIVQPPAQQQPVIIQQQPRMRIENTNCYTIGDRLFCNTYSY